MAFWWDLLQQYQIGNRRRETSTLEDQVANLEERVEALEDVVSQMLTALDNNSPAAGAPGQDENGAYNQD
jgi:hypothetical protein